MGVIEVRGISVYAYHGCLAEEAKIGGEYIVDVEVEADLTASVSSDDLSVTVDYVAVNRIVKEEMAIRSKLIEHVAGRVMNKLRMEFPAPKKITVKVSKLAPPINGNVDHVSVTVVG